MINQYIKNLDRDVRLELYGSFGLGMYAVMIALFIWAIVINRIKIKQALFIIVCFAGAFLLSPRICVMLDKLSNGLIPDRNMGVRFLPFLAVYTLLSWICRVKTSVALDVAVPMYVGGRGITIVGCIFPGCCHGHFAEWGIYSHHAGYNTVPCPLIDAVASVMIAVLIVRCSKKSGVNGRTAAYGLILFGVLRYVIDILRDNDKVLGLFTFEGVFGLVYICIGLIMLYVLGKKYTTTPRNDSCCQTAQHHKSLLLEEKVPSESEADVVE